MPSDKDQKSQYVFLRQMMMAKNMKRIGVRLTFCLTLQGVEFRFS